MKNNDDIPTADTNEIKQLINRVKRGELDQGDELLIEKLLNILLMIISLLQRKHTSTRGEFHARRLTARTPIISKGQSSPTQCTNVSRLTVG